MGENPLRAAGVRRVLISAGTVDGGRSGVGRYVIELVAALARECPEIELFVAGLGRDRGRFPSVDDSHWVTIPERCAGGMASFFWHQMVLPRHLKRLRLDLYHSPTYRRILAFSPVPQIATIHDCAPFVLRDKYGLWRGILGRQIAPRLARRCRRVIAVSHATAMDLERYMRLSREKITTVWNGIDPSVYYPCTGGELQEFLHRQGQREPYFLYVARLEHPGKNHVGLIEAFERYRRAHPDSRVQLLFAGAEWRGAEAIHARIEDSPWRQDIRALGFVPDDALPYWYSGCQALVVPSRFEGFGLPVIEALACGAPAGLADLQSLREVGGDQAHYFDPDNPEEIAACLALLAETPRERGAEADAKRARWTARFSWTECARGVGEIIQTTGPG